MGSKITLVIGILGVLLGGLILLISLGLYATQNGRVSFDEALPGMIGGCVCSFISVIIAVVGLVFVMKNKKSKTIAPSTSSTPPTP